MFERGASQEDVLLQQVGHTNLEYSDQELVFDCSHLESLNLRYISVFCFFFEVGVVPVKSEFISRGRRWSGLPH